MAAPDPSAPPEPAGVLVVDDAPANLVALGVVLAPLGVRVVEARSGAEALEKVEHERFAVVLLDVQMPEMDGFEVARRLRQSATGAEVPIIFLTAMHRDEQYARKGYASGAADYITKPFDADVLCARVKAFVDLFHQHERRRVEQVAERTRERDRALEQLARLLESERASRREAEIANSAKDAFLATVSHELRTPLSAILGWSVIARRHACAPEVERALSIIERNARAQMRIIEDVLDLGRIVGGKMRLELSTTRVADAIEGAVLAVRPAADSKRVRLDVRVDEDTGDIDADPDRLQQIVWNVLSNAIKFTPSGGRVEVSSARREPAVIIEIRDDGLGIPADFLPSVFEPFRQADGSTARRQGGLGLGLSIVKELVHAHGGTISAQSEGEGRGATFTIEMPIHVSPEVEHESIPAMPRAEAVDGAPRETRLDGVRLLVVDDDDDSRELIACILTDHGANVTSAASVEEALRVFERVGPDVVLSDIAMPGSDGYSLIRGIRALPAGRGGATPAVALTAYARAVDAERALAAGFQAHVTKPVDPERLARVVSDLASGAAT